MIARARVEAHAHADRLLGLELVRGIGAGSARARVEARTYADRLLGLQPGGGIGAAS